MGPSIRPVGRLIRTARERLYGWFDCQTHIIALHDHALLYYAVPKVANTSLKTIFSDIIVRSLPTEVVKELPADRPDTELFRKSRRPIMYDLGVLLCKHDVKRFATYTGFAFVRNPWDRLVSCYANKLSQKHLFQGPERRGTLRALQRAGLYSEEMTFADFVKAVSLIPDTEANRHFRSQHCFLTDRTGALMPDRLYRFERLSDGFAELVSEFDLPAVDLPHKKPTAHRDYREYYTIELRDAVARRYARDIELFGYEF